MKLDKDMLVRLIRQHFNEEGQRNLTFTRWKDGIDVQYPTYAVEAFAESVYRAALDTAKSRIERDSMPSGWKHAAVSAIGNS